MSTPPAASVIVGASATEPVSKALSNQDRDDFEVIEGGHIESARAPVLLLLDPGSVPGPGFVRAHLDAHDAGARTVLGYMHGTRPGGPPPGLAAALAAEGPEAVVARYRDDRSFGDIRHDLRDDFDTDPAAAVAPWALLRTGNLSIRAADLHAAGGIATDIHNHTTRDLDLGLRLHRNGIRLTAARDAWTVEVPRSALPARPASADRADAEALLPRHPGPDGELLWWAAREDFHITLEAETRNLLRATETANRDASHELEAALADLAAPAARIAVLGCGDTVPEALADAHLFDFDPAVVEQLRGSGRPSAARALGLRTPLAPGIVDHLVVTSRLRGLWERWSGDVLAEAERLGARVTGPLGSTGTARETA